MLASRTCVRPLSQFSILDVANLLEAINLYVEKSFVEFLGVLPRSNLHDLTDPKHPLPSPKNHLD